MQSLLQGNQLHEEEHEITNFFAPLTEAEILDDGVACAEGDVRPLGLKNWSEKIITTTVNDKMKRKVKKKT
eukprot:10182465-Karenia_brevis.AAC.1